MKSLNPYKLALEVYGNTLYACNLLNKRDDVDEIVKKYIYLGRRILPDNFYHYAYSSITIENGAPVIRKYTNIDLWKDYSNGYISGEYPPLFPGVSRETLETMKNEIQDTFLPPIRVVLEKRIVEMPIPCWVNASMSSLLDLGGEETTECHVTTAYLWEEDAKKVADEFVNQLKNLNLI